MLALEAPGNLGNYDTNQYYSLLLNLGLFFHFHYLNEYKLRIPHAEPLRIKVKNIHSRAALGNVTNQLSLLMALWFRDLSVYLHSFLTNPARSFLAQKEFF